ncbi:MAG: hypothetical protein LRY72_17085 [Saccharospirillaceae bacterium]|nr:hypothetical protein [Saccharospirillaceae bacterium]
MSDLHTGIAAMMAEQVRHNAAQRLQTVIQALEMSIHEIERYQAKLLEAANDAERVELINWTVQYLVCYAVPNMRIDLLADSQFELKALAQE